MSIEREKIDWKDEFADFFDMPGEVMSGLPKITIIGDRKVSIVNHLGITEYSVTRIRIRLGKVEVETCGNMLKIVNITKEEVLIEGRVDKVGFLRGGTE